MSFAWSRLQAIKETGVDPVTGMTIENLSEAGISSSALENVKSPTMETKLYDIFNNQILTNQDIIFQVLLLQIAKELTKTKEGHKTLQILGKELIKGLFGTLDSLGQASAANHLSAWANPLIVSMVLERCGLIRPNWNAQFHAGLSQLSGIKMGLSVIENLFSEKGAFPTMISFAKGAYPTKTIMQGKV